MAPPRAARYDGGVTRAPIDDKLIDAACALAPALVSQALALGADPDARDAQGFTALMRAVSSRSSPGMLDCVRLLSAVSDLSLICHDWDLANGPAPRFGYLADKRGPLPVSRPSILGLAVDARDTERGAVVRILLAAGAGAAEPGLGSATGLMAAVAHRDLGLLALLSPRCPHDARDEHGTTALMWAARHADVSAFLALLPRSDPDAVDDYGRSALDFLRLLRGGELAAMAAPLEAALAERERQILSSDLSEPVRLPAPERRPRARSL